MKDKKQLGEIKKILKKNKKKYDEFNQFIEENIDLFKNPVTALKIIERLAPRVLELLDSKKQNKYKIVINKIKRLH